VAFLTRTAPSFPRLLIYSDKNLSGRSAPDARLAAFHDLPEATSLRHNLRQWEVDNCQPRKWTMTAISERSCIPNDMYKTIPLSGLREGRDINLSDDGNGPHSSIESSHELSTNLADQLLPGTLVELRPLDSRIPILAVIVGVRNAAYYFFSDGGQLLCSNHMQLPAVLFSSPDFAPVSEMKPLADYIGSSPEENIRPDALFMHQPPLNMGAPLRQRLNDFSKAAAALYQKHLRHLAGAEALIPGTEVALKSLGEITDILLPINLDDAAKKSPKLRYAVHLALLRSPLGAFRNLNVLQSPPRSKSNMYLVMSAKEIQSTYSILEQTRLISLEVCRNPTMSLRVEKVPTKLKSCRHLWSFLLKARRLVTASRQHRGEPRFGMLRPAVGPQPARLNPHVDSWTEEEKEIIGFLQRWVGLRTSHLSGVVFTAGSSILRFTGLYESMERLDEGTCFTFLKEIGWMPSWELSSRYRNQIPGVEPIPGGADGGYRRHQPANFWDDLDVDFAAGRRRNWSSIVAYAVDSEDTILVDDAVSIEPTDKADEFWIHVHVADPTAFIKHDSTLARYLATVPENLYTQGYFASMLPADFMDDAVDRWGLAEGRPCLTFSTRLTSAGETVDFRVQPGTLGEVVYMTYDELGKIIPGSSSAEADYKASELDALSVGPSPSPARERPRPGTAADRQLASANSLGSEKERDLASMYDILLAYRQSRAERTLDLRQMPQRKLELAFDAATSPAPWPTNVAGRTTWSGDPTISIGYVPPWSDGLVSIAMKMAGETAARWCIHRRIPVPFVTQPSTLRHPNLVGALTNKLNELADEGIAPPPALWKSYVSMAGPSVISLEAQPVARMGVDMFTRVTSPLRRFFDCITHWQIHAALAHEAQTGMPFSVANTSAGNVLPWSAQDLALHLTCLGFNASCARRLSSSAVSQGWIYQALLRAWLYEKDKLPAHFTFTVHDKFSSSLKGDIGYLGLSALMYRDNLQDTCLMADIRSGDMFAAEIRSVDAFKCQIEMTPLRKLSAQEVDAELRRRYGGRDVQEMMRSVLAETEARSDFQVEAPVVEVARASGAAM
jgi:hypothetical protein